MKSGDAADCPPGADRAVDAARDHACTPGEELLRGLDARAANLAPAVGDGQVVECRDSLLQAAPCTSPIRPPLPPTRSPCVPPNRIGAIGRSARRRSAASRRLCVRLARQAATAHPSDGFSLPTPVDKRVRNSLRRARAQSGNGSSSGWPRSVAPEDLGQLIRPAPAARRSHPQVRLEAPNKLTLLCITDSYHDGAPRQRRGRRRDRDRCCSSCRSAIRASYSRMARGRRGRSRRNRPRHGQPQPEAHLRELRRRRLEPLRSRGEPGRRDAAGRPLQPALHLRRRRASARRTWRTRSGTRCSSVSRSRGSR